MENKPEMVTESPTLYQRVERLPHKAYRALWGAFKAEFNLLRSEQMRRRLTGEYKMSEEQREFIENFLKRHDN